MTPADLRARVLHALRTTPVPGTPPGLGLPAHHNGETGYFNWCALCTRDTQALAQGVLAAIRTPSPRPADNGLRDRIRQAICEATGFEWDPDWQEVDEYGDAADAVLAVLAVQPAPVERAAVLREAIRRVEDPAERAQTATGSGLGWEAARDVLRRMADEAQRPETEAAPQCTAGLLPATDEAVDRCIRRGKHDSHKTASGVLWGNGSADETPGGDR
ncbi:hypothetical protein [Streptomyces sp. NPDC088674]|uniref:hypothetical protein n=1 Tax=Streptomyces sp. NPDC088674 TaxID=3365869 RepID=UPI00380A087C